MITEILITGARNGPSGHQAYLDDIILSIVRTEDIGSYVTVGRKYSEFHRIWEIGDTTIIIMITY